MKQKELLFISLTIFLTIIAWVLIDIYKVSTEFNINDGFESLQTIDFSLDTNVLKILQEKTP